MEISYKTQNPGNEHLSIDLIPNKITYLIFFIIWVFVFLISTVLIVYRAYKKKAVNRITIMILANYFVMMAYSMIHYIYWILFSKYGKAWLSYQLTLIFLEAIVLCIYLIIINVVANGYKIVHEQFNWNAFAKNIAIISILVVTSLLMQYTNFFLLIFLVVEIIALVVLLKMDISKTISM